LQIGRLGLDFLLSVVVIFDNQNGQVIIGAAAAITNCGGAANIVNLVTLGNHGGIPVAACPVAAGASSSASQTPAAIGNGVASLDGAGSGQPSTGSQSGTSSQPGINNQPSTSGQPGTSGQSSINSSSDTSGQPGTSGASSQLGINSQPGAGGQPGTGGSHGTSDRNYRPDTRGRNTTSIPNGGNGVQASENEKTASGNQGATLTYTLRTVRVTFVQTTTSCAPTVPICPLGRVVTSVYRSTAYVCDETITTGFAATVTITPAATRLLQSTLTGFSSSSTHWSSGTEMETISAQNEGRQGVARPGPSHNTTGNNHLGTTVLATLLLMAVLTGGCFLAWDILW